MSLFRPRHAAALLATGVLVLGTAAAWALNQPDGTPIPVMQANNNLWILFQSLGEPIDPQANAADVPETFNPSCSLTFTVLSRGTAAFQNVFGWYNATGAAPATNDLHVLIPCTAQPPQAFPLAIKQDPAYLGGQVGFFMITPENQGSYCAAVNNIGYVYYSQKEFNPDNQATAYIHLLTYDSKVKPKSFYFAWEDLYGGGDNEFMDLVTRVDGISCSGGGGACQTGKPGICADGTEQCQNGSLTCVQSNQPGPEKCDGLDNNCDGMTDEGMGLCPTNQVCVQGNCVPKCGSGEFKCTASKVCTAEGVCVDPACAMVTCPAGQKCTAGKCAGPCDGVTCPHGLTCRVGACVDPCSGITCDNGQICIGGACTDKCDCAGCAANEACQPDGHCLAMPCVNKMCPAGQYCKDDGTCADPCKGAVCPAGETCSMGQCVAKMGSGSGGGSGSGTGGSGFSSGVGGSAQGSTGSGRLTSGAASGAGGAGGGIFSDGPTATKTGCGCHVGTEPAGGNALALSLLGLAGIAARRRRTAAPR